MDDRKLEVLIAAVDLGSFSKAARECHCTQSAVTQLVGSIEAELGCHLLIRSHAGVALTREGAAIMPDVREASDALDRLKRKAADLRARRPVFG